MAIQNRKTLREYFKAGNLPTGENFSDLIDSMINIRNDGINRSNEHGFYIATTAEKDRLLSFFRGDDGRAPVWIVDMNNADNSLCIRPASLEKESKEQDIRFTMSPDGNIGIKKRTPVYEMDINGTIRCSGRIGNYNHGNGEIIKITADGEWHELLDNLNGCNAFEIVAGVGKKKTGKYALMHAVAVNIFGNRGKIRYTQSSYFSRNNSIRLKWVGNQKSYALMMRTMSDYGSVDNKKICVNCSITKLWFDETMEKCVER
jgi:hypothetical protein